MTDKEICEMAAKEASKSEKEGSGSWLSVFRGFIKGFNASQKLKEKDTIGNLDSNWAVRKSK